MTALLPAHPSKLHPLTGKPLRALWVRPDGRFCWPIMGGSEPAPEPTPTPTPDPDPEPDDDVSKAKGETKKWRGRAESNYEILRKLGITKPEEAEGVLERLQRQEALEDELSSEKDKAVKEAKTATTAELDAKYQPMLAETAFRVAIGDRKSEEEIDDFLGDLNLSRFLTDKGAVDVTKVLARVEQFAGVPTSGGPSRGPQMPGGGTPRPHGGAKPGEAGRLAAERMGLVKAPN